MQGERLEEDSTEQLTQAQFMFDTEQSVRESLTALELDFNQHHQA